MAEQPDSLEELKLSIRQELLSAAARGVTTIHEILDKPAELRALQELERDGQLPIRVDVIVRVVESGFPKWALLELGLQHGFGSDRLRISGIKMSIDGGFTGRQAYWSKNPDDECIGDHAEHCGPCGNHAIVRIQQDELDEVVSAYHEAGMRICVHAIGDRAADMILRSYEMALRGRDTSDLRHRIEHLGNWLMTDTRIKQTKTLGVTPVPNPAFFYFLGAEAALTLGPQRTEESFPMRRLLDEGFAVTFGADGPLYWPVDPLRDAGATVTRETRDGLPISPDQAITPYEALGAVTSSAAWLGYMEDHLGTLEAGKVADIAVLASDPLSSGQNDIGAIPVDATFVAGRAVWESDSLRRALEVSQRPASQSPTAPIS